MEIEELEDQIQSLESEVAFLRDQINSQSNFVAELLGRLAHENGIAKDLGMPNDPPLTGHYEQHLEIILSYNRGANL